MAIPFLVIFWIMQVVATLLFKYGSSHPSRWLVGFLVGNVLLVSSVWFLMKVYTKMNPNVAVALAGGGSFVLVQVAMALVFHSRPAPAQWIGISAMAIGMVVASSTGGK